MQMPRNMTPSTIMIGNMFSGCLACPAILLPMELIESNIFVLLLLINLWKIPSSLCELPVDFDQIRMAYQTNRGPDIWLAWPSYDWHKFANQFNFRAVYF